MTVVLQAFANVLCAIGSPKSEKPSRWLQRVLWDLDQGPVLSFSGFFESLSAKQLRSTVSATSDEVAAAWMATDFANCAKLIENIKRPYWP